MSSRLDAVHQQIDDVLTSDTQVPYFQIMYLHSLWQVGSATHH